MSKTLLNECRACNMKFDSSDQLNNHTRKFCQGSDYSDVQKLQEKIYQKELRELRLSKGAITDENMEKIDNRKKRELQYAGQMSLGDLKEKVKAEENEYRKVQALATKDRNEEMEREINKLREDRAQLKLEKKEDEQQLEDLLRELEVKKEKELRNRIEKDQIRRALVDLEKAKLAVIGTEKKRELDEIHTEKEALKLKEKDLLREIEEMDENQKQLEVMRKEEVNRMQEEVKKMDLQTKENNNVNLAMVQERAEKVTALQMRREQLEGEKIKIEKNIGHLKNGDVHLIQKDGLNYATLSAKNLIGDMNDLKKYNIPGAREKLKANEDRIKNLKNQQLQGQQPYDADELLHKGNRGLTDNVAAYYQDQLKHQVQDEGIRGFRENLESIADRQDAIIQNESRKHGDIQNYASNVLNDLDQIKQQYKDSGGDDPNFIAHMSNLENFYNKTKQYGEKKNQSQLNLNRLPLQLDGGNPLNQNGAQLPPPPPPPQQEPSRQQTPYQPTPFQQQAQTNILPNQSQQQPVINISVPQQNQQQTPMIQQSMPAYPQQPMYSQMPQMVQTVPPPQQQMMPQLGMEQFMQANINDTNQQGGFSLGQMMGDRKNNPFGIFALKKEGFVQNAPRNPDLTEEERTLMNLTAQEVDQLRMLSKIPVGTELYRFKMEQFKELSNTRVEIEKIVQEQRLQRLKKDYELERRDQDRRIENEKWIDDQRKFIISNQVKGQDDGNYQGYNGIGGSSGGGGYQPPLRNRSQQQFSQDPNNISPSGPIQYQDTSGFNVFWDYALGLPARISYCQLVFGIYHNGETLYSPKLVDPKDCDPQGNQQTRCLFGDNYLITEIPPNHSTIMVIELQIPYSKKIEENIGRTESYGWTVINLFDAKKQLNRGKWRCPIYFGPTDPQIQLQNIKNLKTVPNSWMYFRLAAPNDPQLGQQRQLYPEQTQHEYQIAQIHSEGGANLRHIPNYLHNQSYEPSMMDRSKLRRPGSRSSLASKDNYSDIHPQSAQSDDRVRRGLEVTVFSINNLVSKSHVKVMIALMEGKTPMVDDNQLACLFNTSIHNPRSHNVNQIRDVLELNQQNPQLYNVSNKQDGDRINFYEKYKFLLDLRKEYRRNKRDIFLGIQVVENKDQNDVNLTQQDAILYDQLDFQLIGWNFIQLTKFDGSILTGDIRDIDLFVPKIKPPPVDRSKVQISDMKINLNLDLFQYDDNQLVQAQNERLNNSKWG